MACTFTATWKCRFKTRAESHVVVVTICCNKHHNLHHKIFARGDSLRCTELPQKDFFAGCKQGPDAVELLLAAVSGATALHSQHVAARLLIEASITAARHHSSAAQCLLHTSSNWQGRSLACELSEHTAAAECSVEQLQVVEVLQPQSAKALLPM